MLSVASVVSRRQQWSWKASASIIPAMRGRAVVITTTHRPQQRRLAGEDTGNDIQAVVETVRRGLS